MANNKIFSNYIFQGNSHISGVTAIYINQDASQNDQAVRLSQLVTELATKQDNLSAGDGIDETLFTGGTLAILYDNVSIGLDGSGNLTIKADGVNDSHIDFGTGTNQVNAGDIPVIDSNDYFTGSTVEQVVEELFNREQNISIVEFLTEEFLEIREGLVAWVVPALYNGKRITGYSAKVTTKNDNVTLQLNNNGTQITSSSATITSTAGVTSSTLNESLSTGDIIQVETTAIGATPSKGLIVNIKIEE